MKLIELDEICVSKKIERDCNGSDKLPLPLSLALTLLRGGICTMRDSRVTAKRIVSNEKFSPRFCRFTDQRKSASRRVCYKIQSDHATRGSGGKLWSYFYVFPFVFRSVPRGERVQVFRSRRSKSVGRVPIEHSLVVKVSEHVLSSI